MFARRQYVLVFLLILTAAGSGCSRPETPPSGGSSTSTRPSRGPEEIRAIRAVLAADDAAGTQRNRAPESMPLHRAIESYVADLEAIDTAGCPGDFVEALARHREAWRASVEFFAPFHSLRGEMHELFERIRAESTESAEALGRVEAKIWDTWDQVESAARRHGAIPTAPD